MVEVISGQPQFRVGLVIAVPHAGRVCRVEKDPRIDSADVAVAKEHVVRPAMPRWIKGQPVAGTHPGQAAIGPARVITVVGQYDAQSKIRSGCYSSFLRARLVFVPEQIPPCRSPPKPFL